MKWLFSLLYFKLYFFLILFFPKWNLTAENLSKERKFFKLCQVDFAPARISVYKEKAFGQEDNVIAQVGNGQWIPCPNEKDLNKNFTYISEDNNRNNALTSHSGEYKIPENTTIKYFFEKDEKGRDKSFRERFPLASLNIEKTTGFISPGLSYLDCKNLESIIVNKQLKEDEKKKQLDFIPRYIQDGCQTKKIFKNSDQYYYVITDAVIHNANHPYNGKNEKSFQIFYEVKPYKVTRNGKKFDYVPVDNVSYFVLGDTLSSFEPTHPGELPPLININARDVRRASKGKAHSNSKRDDCPPKLLPNRQTENAEQLSNQLDEENKKLLDSLNKSITPVSACDKTNWKPGADAAESYVLDDSVLNKNQTALHKDQYSAIEILARTCYGEMRSCGQKESNIESYMMAQTRILYNRGYITKIFEDVRRFDTSIDNDKNPLGTASQLVDSNQLNRIRELFQRNSNYPAAQAYEDYLIAAAIEKASFSTWNSYDANLKEILCFKELDNEEAKKAKASCVKIASMAILDQQNFLQATNSLKNIYFYTSDVGAQKGLSEIKTKPSVDGVKLTNKSCLRFFKDKNFDRKRDAALKKYQDLSKQ